MYYFMCCEMIYLNYEMSRKLRIQMWVVDKIKRQVCSVLFVLITQTYNRRPDKKHKSSHWQFDLNSVYVVINYGARGQMKKNK